MTTSEIIQYYIGLLIIQYIGKPKARATIGTVVTPILQPDYNLQLITFVKTPASGVFKLAYDGTATGSLNWNDSAATIETALNAILTSPLTSLVEGSIASGLKITFLDYIEAVQILSVTDSTLEASDSSDVIPLVTPIGIQLPFEIQNAFNLLGTDTAVGVQLDVIGKYVGVKRSANGFNGPVTLNDEDFLTLIQMAIVKNASNSSLRSIQLLLNRFFAGNVFVFDYKNMQMSYLIDSDVGSEDLISLFVTEHVLPKPMGVSLSVIVAPEIDEFFGFRTYAAEAGSLETPFNFYASYDTDTNFLSYADSIPV